jgi:hypothetical protein
MAWTTSDEAELMGDLVGYFPDGAEFGIDEDIGLAIEGIPFRQETMDLTERVRVFQQGAMALIPNALPDRRRGGPETNDQRMGPETRQVFRLGGQTAPGGDDELLPGAQLLDDLSFVLAEASFAVLAEDVADALMRLLFDEVIGIDHLEV